MKFPSAWLVAAMLVAGSAVSAQTKPMPGVAGAESVKVSATVVAEALMVSVTAPAAKK